MFIRFTYVEFSWDVMEPISYFVGLANVIMGYIYFMFTQRFFSFGTWQSQMMQNAMDRQLKTGSLTWTNTSKWPESYGEGTWFGNTRVILFYIENEREKERARSCE